jgi:hypothetical protein
MIPKLFTCTAALALISAVVMASGAPVKAQGVGGYGIGPWPYSDSQSGQSEPYGAAPPETAWCAQRYRSFNPATGTYLGYDRRQHVCRAPVADQGSAFGYAPPPVAYAPTPMSLYPPPSLNEYTRYRNDRQLSGHSGS